MAYLYEYDSLLIPAEFLANALCAKSGAWVLLAVGIWDKQAAREISRQTVFDRERVLHTSLKILDKQIKRESVT